MEKPQLALHVFWVQSTRKGPTEVPFTSVLCPWPPWQWGKSNSSILWSAVPLSMLRSSHRRNSGCSWCREGLGGVSDSSPLLSALQSSSFPSHPAAFPALSPCFHAPVQRGRFLSHSLAGLLSERDEHVVSMSHHSAKKKPT